MNNGSHWYWNQGGMEPEHDMYAGGSVPTDSATYKLLVVRTLVPSPASSYGAVIGVDKNMGVYGRGICEVF